MASPLRVLKLFARYAEEQRQDLLTSGCSRESDELLHGPLGASEILFRNHHDGQVAFLRGGKDASCEFLPLGQAVGALVKEGGLTRSF